MLRGGDKKTSKILSNINVCRVMNLGRIAEEVERAYYNNKLEFLKVYEELHESNAAFKLNNSKAIFSKLFKDELFSHQSARTAWNYIIKTLKMPGVEEGQKVLYLISSEHYTDKSDKVYWEELKSKLKIGDELDSEQNKVQQNTGTTTYQQKTGPSTQNNLDDYAQQVKSVLKNVTKQQYVKFIKDIKVD